MSVTALVFHLETSPLKIDDHIGENFLANTARVSTNVEIKKCHKIETERIRYVNMMVPILRYPLSVSKKNYN